MDKSKHRGGVIVNRVDWLAVAVGNVGGIPQMARKLGVKSKMVIHWLDHGLGAVAFETVVKLAWMGDVPLEFLARRLGPWVDPVD